MKTLDPEITQSMTYLLSKLRLKNLPNQPLNVSYYQQPAAGSNGALKVNNAFP